MKLRILLYAMLFCTLATACHPEDAPLPVDDALTGTWQWLSSSGGIAGTTHTPQNTHKEITIIITPAKQFITYENGKKIRESGYTISRSKSIYTGEEADILESDFMRWSFKVQNNQLYLSDEYADGYSHEYKRIKSATTHSQAD